MRPCPFGSKHSSMLSSKRTIPLDPRPQQTPGALLSRSLPNLVSGRRRCAGGRSVAAHVALQQAYAAPAGSRRVSGPAPASACCAAAGSAVNTPAADTSSTTTDDYRTVLQDLLVWLVNNGVTGVGQAGSKVALYQDEGGDRGIIAVEDISAGVELVRVPLRLAITDVMEDKQRSELVGQGALWQDRLVAKLLHEVQLGKQSAWYPYIRALPKSVPSALESFTASEALEVQFPAPVAAIQAHADKMATSWQACRPDAIYGADPKTYRWAHLVGVDLLTCWKQTCWKLLRSWRSCSNSSENRGVASPCSRLEVCQCSFSLSVASRHSYSGGSLAVPNDTYR
eukprot:GHUV01034845.1.p1 GENE.GHUV01034845.1~~GHUV01034845.1.p1  ORF type:complete len:340 (+),score=61.77 GHUV01034845.1:794-1813(+)